MPPTGIRKGGREGGLKNDNECEKSKERGGVSRGNGLLSLYYFIFAVVAKLPR